jgi:hypothetical protein
VKLFIAIPHYLLLLNEGVAGRAYEDKSLADLEINYFFLSALVFSAFIYIGMLIYEQITG